MQSDRGFFSSIISDPIHSLPVDSQIYINIGRPFVLSSLQIAVTGNFGVE